MISKQRAMLNTAAFASPLFLGLLYSLLFNLGIPNSIIIPTAGGGLMNLGFWLFYRNTIGPIPELSKFYKNQDMFLLVSILHLVAISILLVFDVGWIFESF